MHDSFICNLTDDMQLALIYHNYILQMPQAMPDSIITSMADALVAFPIYADCALQHEYGLP